MNNNIFSKEFLYAVKEAGIIDVVCPYYGGDSTWVLLANGDLYGCGYNAYGQQGNGSTSNVTTFTKRASNVKQVACSMQTTWYIDNNGDLYGCGNNSYGQQGNGTYGTGTAVKTFTKRASNVKQVVCSYNTTWYIDNNGDLYGCGLNNAGQQGNGSTSNVSTFIKRASNVKQVAIDLVNGTTTWYIDNNGDLYGCGNNSYGQQGNGTYGTGTAVKTFTKRASNVKQFDCSQSTTWYIDNNGDLYGCGEGQYGQQGNGGSPTEVTSFTKEASNVVQVACGANSTRYINSSGDLYTCGYNGYGQQGINHSYNIVYYFNKAGSNVIQVIDTYDTLWYINSSGDLYGCGHNNIGQQGSGGTSDIYLLSKRASNVTKMACSSGTTWYIDSNGDLYGCGAGGSGQQGNGSTSNVLTFENKMQYLGEEIFIRVSNSNGYNFNLTVNGSTYTVGGSLSIPILANKDYSATIAGNAYATNINSASITYSGGTQSVSITSPLSSNSFTFPASTSDITLTVNTSYAGCVLYNTNILLAGGTTKQAKDISVGDILQTYNEDTKTFEPNKALEVIPNKKDDIIKVTFNDDSFIELTSGHPFLTQKGWASYDNDKTIKEKLYNGSELYKLEIGDSCLCQDNTFKTITSIEYENMGMVDVYDYTIENAHTFIGNNKVLHNVTSGGG